MQKPYLPPQYPGAQETQRLSGLMRESICLLLHPPHTEATTAMTMVTLNLGFLGY
jgi:hypothetical protein